MRTTVKLGAAQRTLTLLLLLALVLAPLTTGAVYGQQAAAPPDYTPPADLKQPPADAVKSATGLMAKTVRPSSNPEKAAASDVVTVQYIGWSGDGKVFDSTYARGNPSTFPLTRVMAGWRECVTDMAIAEKRRCWIPQDLAYKGQAGRPTGTVVFDIELLDRRQNPTLAPADVKEIPTDATRIASGLAFRILRPGTGTRRPTQFSRVNVHYTGWTTDGKMFDSSVARNQPTTMSLDNVITGWTEGVQLMVEGERRRFWIPQDLAYRGEAGNPRGMLVFDIELIRIE
jgi:FKBP-type peptidyl-prolyl cis-trans isomerase